jgi:hypothetical protein
VPDAPELILRRTLAELLNGWSLAVYQPGGQIPDRGVKVTQPVPTTVKEFTFLTSPPTTSDGGRADVLYRVQFFTCRLGDVEAWASELFSRLDHREYTPSILGISLAWETSRLYFDADTQGRAAVACNYAFRGRRP